MTPTPEFVKLLPESQSKSYDPGDAGEGRPVVVEHREDYPSEWAAMTAVSKRLGMSAETLSNWVRRNRSWGDRDGVNGEAAEQIRALKRRNAELEQTIEILKAATSLRAESDPRSRR